MRLVSIILVLIIGKEAVCRRFPVPGRRPLPIRNPCKDKIGVGGLCRAHIPSFTFNHIIGKCEGFIYGGCGGSNNRFGTKEDCEKQCGKDGTEERGNLSDKGGDWKVLFKNGTIVTGVGNPPKVWRLVSSKGEAPSFNDKEHTGLRLRSRGSMASVQEHDHQNLVGIGCSHPMEVQCLTLNVYGATYASCNGYYMVTLDRVPWAPCRQVYKHVYKNRYIFWNAHGYGWSIGTKEDLITGKHYYSSHVDSKEPWQEEWRANNNVLVKCSKGDGDDESFGADKFAKIQRQLSEEFEKVDKDEDGTLTWEELEELFPEFDARGRQKTKMHIVNRILDRVDGFVDGKKDGEVSKDEYVDGRQATMIEMNFWLFGPKGPAKTKDDKAKLEDLGTKVTTIDKTKQNMAKVDVREEHKHKKVRELYWKRAYRTHTAMFKLGGLFDMLALFSLSMINLREFQTLIQNCQLGTGIGFQWIPSDCCPFQTNWWFCKVEDE